MGLWWDISVGCKRQHASSSLAPGSNQQGCAYSISGRIRLAKSDGTTSFTRACMGQRGSSSPFATSSGRGASSGSDCGAS